MKIRMMTFHTPKNYGAVLQAYALQTYLKGFCDDVKIVDYNTPKLQKRYPLVSKPSSLKEFLLTVISLFYLPKKINKYRCFDNFAKQHLDLTERYRSTEELYNNPPDCDLLITGSDQVFNPNRCSAERQAFYLNFGGKDIKKVSYAASFGVPSIPKEKQQEISLYMEKLDALSVREERGVDIIKLISGKNAIEVLDPVFLLNSASWEDICEEYGALPKRYLLYYRLLNANNGDPVVKELANRLGLEIVVITDNVRKKVDSRYILRDVGPSQFLWLYSNASFVVTNAFHGTAFSIVFKKQFVFCDENQRTQERSANLLKKLGLEGRMLPRTIKDLLFDKIDYEMVYVKLNAYIDSSKEYLQSVINNSW